MRLKMTAPLGALAFGLAVPALAQLEPIHVTTEPVYVMTVPAEEAGYYSRYEVLAPRPGSPAASQALIDDVKVALADDPAVNPAKIEVDMDAGAVTLRGQVRSDAEATRAAQTARSAAGTTNVHNYLRPGFMS
jgi:hypothetical protein